MPQFIVRPELVTHYQPDLPAKLHAHMAAQGFQQFAPKGTGGILMLPTATYWGEANGNAMEVANALRDSIQQTLSTKARVLAILFADAHQAEPV